MNVQPFSVDRIVRFELKCQRRRFRWPAMAALLTAMFVLPAAAPAQDADLLPGELSIELGRDLLGTSRVPTIREIKAAVEQVESSPLLMFSLVGDNNNHYAPAWSSDGQVMAFLRADLDERTCKLLVMRPARAREPEVLYDDFLSFEHMPCWNQGPRRLLVFSSNNEDSRDENIHLADLRAEPRPVTSGFGVKVLPSLIAQGDLARLVYRRGDELLHVTFSVSQPQRQATISWGQGAEARFSPTGDHAAVVRVGTDGQYRLCLRDIETNDELVLYAAENALMRNPSWSPDGHYVAFFVQQRGQVRWDLYIASHTATPPAVLLAQGVRVQEDFRHVVPAWSPDSSKIWFFHDSGQQGYYALQWVTADGQDRGDIEYPREITTAMDIATCPDPHRPVVAFSAVRQHALDIYVLLLNHE